MSRSKRIIHEVARSRMLSVQEIKSRSNFPHFVAARKEIAERLSAELGLTTGQIAMRIGRTDWTVRYYLDAEYRKRNIAKGIRWYHSRKNAA